MTPQSVPKGGPLLVLESMKMEYVVPAPVGGVVREVATAPGEIARTPCRRAGRRDTGHRTARENVADLCDTFTRWPSPPSGRAGLDELIEKTSWTAAAGVGFAAKSDFDVR